MSNYDVFVVSRLGTWIDLEQSRLAGVVDAWSGALFFFVLMSCKYKSPGANMTKIYQNLSKYKLPNKFFVFCSCLHCKAQWSRDDHWSRMLVNKGSDQARDFVGRRGLCPRWLRVWDQLHAHAGWKNGDTFILLFLISCILFWNALWIQVITMIYVI